MAMIEVYSKTTGEKQIIPEHWLESTDPRINNFRKTPLTTIPDGSDTTTKNKES